LKHTSRIPAFQDKIIEDNTMKTHSPFFYRLILTALLLMPLAALHAAEPKTGDSKRLDLGDGVTLETLYLPPGEFMMGSTPEEKAWATGIEGGAQPGTTRESFEGEQPRWTRHPQLLDLRVSAQLEHPGHHRPPRGCDRLGVVLRVINQTALSLSKQHRTKSPTHPPHHEIPSSPSSHDQRPRRMARRCRKGRHLADGIRAARGLQRDADVAAGGASDLAEGAGAQ
jgi:hypothetical protein